MKKKFYVALFGVLLVIILTGIIVFVAIHKNKTPKPKQDQPIQIQEKDNNIEEQADYIWKDYSSPVYKITFKYPAWKMSGGEYRTIGEAGGAIGNKGEFIHISAFHGGGVYDAVRFLINWKQDPYSPNPNVVAFKIDGQEARLIIPEMIFDSNLDQSYAGMFGLLIQYPQTLKIPNENVIEYLQEIIKTSETEKYNYILIDFYGPGFNLNRVKEIAKTAHFIGFPNQ